MLTLTDMVCRRGERALFAPVSLQVSSGQCVELLGANGSGKSTLLRTLAGTHRQFTGVYQVDVLLYQGHRLGLDELLTPVENLRWHADLQGRPISQSDIAQLLQRVGMYEYALTPCAALSQGQQRRVGMARWLLSPPCLWLLDEPLTALDTAGQQLLFDMMAEHCERGGAILCATHTPLDLPDKRQFELSAP